MPKFPESFPHQSRLSRCDGLNATRRKRFDTASDDTKAWRDLGAFGPIIARSIAAV